MKRMTVFALFLFLSSQISLTAVKPDFFPPVQHQETRRVLQCLAPLLQSIHVDPDVIRRSRVFPINLDDFYTNRWNLIPPEYARRVLDRIPIPRDAYTIPDSERSGLYPLWYFYLFNLLTTHFQKNLKWNPSFAKTLAIPVATDLLGSCILHDSRWDTLYETLHVDFDSSISNRYPGLITASVLYLFLHRNLPNLVKTANHWYHTPALLQSIKAHRNRNFQRLRHALLKTFFNIDEPLAQSLLLRDEISGFLTIHKSYPAYRVPEQGVNTLEQFLKKARRPNKTRSIVLDLPELHPFLPFHGDRGFSKEEIHHSLKLLFKQAPDYWGHYGKSWTLPRDLYRDVLYELQAHGITPLLCNDSDPQTKPWVTFTYQKSRITLTHVLIPYYPGDPNIYDTFFDLGMSTLMPLTDPVSCILTADPQTHPDFLIITGRLSSPQIRRLMKRIRPPIRVVLWGNIPPYFYKKYPPRGFSPIFYVKNWIFTDHYHIGLTFKQGRLTLLPLK